MSRLLAAVALGAGLLLAPTSPAVACDFEHCPGTSVVCAQLGCPLVCTTNLPVVDRHICIG
jgi:hypothetical protein